MEYFLLLIPVLISGLVCLVLWRLGWPLEKIGPIFAFPIGICVIIVPLMSLIMRSGNFDDTEYLSYYYTKIRHLDEWDEWIERTCTRRVADGTDSEGNTIYREEEYDCSYRDYHPERWLKYDNRGNEVYIDKEEYEALKREWGTPERFIDMHRDYYRIDGDAQEHDWCGHWEHCKTFTVRHTYENRVLGSQSAFRFRDITEAEADSLGLYNYPDVKEPPIVGHRASGRINQRFRYLNAYYGRANQIHVFVLVYPYQKGVSIVEEQRAYWQGGNKNEFVVCLGIDPTWKIHWAQCFSWQDDITLDVKCRQYLMSQGKMNLDGLALWIQGNLRLWKRKEFKDFSYIKSFLKENQLESIMWTVLFLTIVSIIGTIISVDNGRATYKNRMSDLW